MTAIRVLLTAALIISACGDTTSDEELGFMRDEVALLQGDVAKLQDQVAEVREQHTRLAALSEPFDEPVVVAALQEFVPENQACDYRLVGQKASEKDVWRWESEVYGLEDLNVLITCDLVSDEYWFTHDVSVQYPLTIGPRSSMVNDQVRLTVVEGVNDYFIGARERFSDFRIGTPEERADHIELFGGREYRSKGDLDAIGAVTYSDQGLYSVFFYFYQHHPGANTTASPVASLNLDLDTGRWFELPALFKAGSRWREAIAVIVRDRWVEAEGADYDPSGIVGDDLEYMDSVAFTMGSDTLSLHAQPYMWRYPGWCCGTSPSHIDIPYAALFDYLDPDGPYRHIVGMRKVTGEAA
jgi:hypothetical protein